MSKFVLKEVEERNKVGTQDIAKNCVKIIRYLAFCSVKGQESQHFRLVKGTFKIFS